jgi:hypothetical protein
MIIIYCSPETLKKNLFFPLLPPNCESWVKARSVNFIKDLTISADMDNIATIS